MVLFGLSGVDAVFSPSVLQLSVNTETSLWPSVSPQAVWEQKLPLREFTYGWFWQKTGSVMWSSGPLLLVLLAVFCQGNHWQPTILEPATGFCSRDAFLTTLLALWLQSAGVSFTVWVLLASLRVLWLDLKLKQVTVPWMLSLARLALLSDSSGTIPCSSCARDGDITKMLFHNTLQKTIFVIYLFSCFPLQISNILDLWYMYWRSKMRY